MRLKQIFHILSRSFFFGFIPAVLIVIGGHHGDWWENVKFWVESLAFYFSIWALFYAEKAAKKSQETEDQLIKYGLSSAENKTNFSSIFQEHLVNQLKRFEKTGGNIYLLLSTPAYGYAAIGYGKFKNFVDALNLHPQCSLEFIFFSPDDHFPYWANVLLWSEIRLKNGKEAKFSENFCQGIVQVFTKLKARSWKLWVTKATTVREFAFFPEIQERKKGDHDSTDRIYLVLTDTFSISQDQYSAGFQARSIRIASFGWGEYVGAPHSYFERIKTCPYTGRGGKDVVLITDQNKLLEPLKDDYILGRTNQRIISFESFLSEIQVMLQSESVRKLLTDRNQLLINILAQCLSYYDYVLQDDLIRPKISVKQGKALCVALNKCLTILNDNGLKEKVNLILSNLSSFIDQEKKLDECEQADASQQGGRSQDATHREKEIIKCIYDLLSSGFGESEYAKNVMLNKDAANQIAN